MSFCLLTVLRRPISIGGCRAKPILVLLRSSSLREQQERRVNAGVPEDQRVAIHADRLIHHRNHQVLGDVHGRARSTPCSLPWFVAPRRTPRAACCPRRCRGPPPRAVDALRSGLDPRQRIRDTHRHVVMAVEAEFGGGLAAPARAATIRAVTSSGSM